MSIILLITTKNIYFSLVPEQPDYQCFENNPDPVNTKESFNTHCLDYDGNIHNENVTLTSCCECLR